MRKCRIISKFFKAICDEHRQHILTLLRKHKTLNVSEIVAKSSISQPTVSHHLRVLLDAGIISSKKKGKNVFYSYEPDTINDCCHRTMNRFGRRRHRKIQRSF